MYMQNVRTDNDRARMELQETVRILEKEKAELRQQLDEKCQELEVKGSHLDESSQGLQGAEEDIMKKVGHVPYFSTIVPETH